MPSKPPIGGTIPGWFTVILLGLVCWLLKTNADDVRAMLRQHDQRIQQVELWRATMESRRPN